MCTPLPDNLDDATVAAMINPAMSSWAALAHRAHFAAGESIFILGATGSAGHLAVQIARRLGAKRVVAVGRNPRALEETISLGADAVISLNQDREALIAAFRAEINLGLDVVLDYLWGAPAEALLAAIVQKGLDHDAGRLRYIQIGNSAGPTITLPAASLRSSGIELIGSGFGSVSMEKIFESLRSDPSGGRKKPVPDQNRHRPPSATSKSSGTPQKKRAWSSSHNRSAPLSTFGQIHPETNTRPPSFPSATPRPSLKPFTWRSIANGEPFAASWAAPLPTQSPEANP